MTCFSLYLVLSGVVDAVSDDAKFLAISFLLIEMMNNFAEDAFLCFANSFFIWIVNVFPSRLCYE